MYGTITLACMMQRAQQILDDPFQNKGTAFTGAERAALGLTGLLPDRVQTLQEQVDAAYAKYLAIQGDLPKRQYLMGLFDRNRVLFYALFAQHVVEFMPIVYDPTIADSIEHYSALFDDPQRACFLSLDHPERIADSLRAAADGRDIRLIVATDGEGVLGIGDWGVQGVDIAVGKLMVYTAAAGVDPACVLPVVIDAGTDNPQLLEDPGYLGRRVPRTHGAEYFAFVDRFVTEARTCFPDVYLHWEDLGRAHAAAVLDTYRDEMATFNDDIQGTGIVVLAAVLGALAVSGQRLVDQTYVCFGAGSAGCGIVEQMVSEMRQSGLSEQQARERFFLVDRQGLLFDDDPELTPKQRPFARRRDEFAHPERLTNLAAVVDAVHPSILVGTSTQPGAFTEPIIRAMADHAERPVIMPLSNPTKLAEATAQHLIEWTRGRALVATGIPAADVEYQGVRYRIGQANNALVYPGLGLGVLASRATRVTETMISAAAHSLGGLVDPREPGAPILPPVAQLRTFSRTLAEGVMRAAVAQGVAGTTVAQPERAVSDTQWSPVYPVAQTARPTESDTHPQG